MSKTVKTACIAAFLSVVGTSMAQAIDYTSAASYNSPYGMTAGEENTPVNPSLRDANGNLTVVNGQFTSSSMSQQSGVQSMTLGSSGVGYGTTGTASAIGNSLNVVTTGNDNTVIVNSTQTNNGNQTATTTMNGH